MTKGPLREIPSGQDGGHLARLNRQSEHKIRLIFRTRGTSHIIRRAIDQSTVFVISAHPSSNH